ncbi:hypothetical protein CPT77_04300 [Snodgrassella alvi]|nr:hypothetical protein CPT77_04300 [Snodgrassella alvi]
MFCIFYTLSPLKLNSKYKQALKTENRKQKTENRKQTIMINLKGFVLNHYKYLIIKYIIIC